MQLLLRRICKARFFNPVFIARKIDNDREIQFWEAHGGILLKNRL